MDTMTGRDIPLMKLPPEQYVMRPVTEGQQAGAAFAAGYAYPVFGTAGEPRVAVAVGDAIFGFDTEVLAGAAIAALREGRS